MKIIWNDALCPEGEEFISISKGRKVFDRVYTPSRDQVIHAASATPSQLHAAHSYAYVADVLAGRVRNGYGDTDPVKLRHILASNGVMIRAIQEAMRDGPGAPPVFAPVNGFHHAHYDNCYGFCTFNGLVAGIAALGDPALKVLIIDGDGHHGDGTDDCLVNIEPRLLVKNLAANEMRREGWSHAIARCLKMTEWDLVIYQAGADAHISDPYGAGYLDGSDWSYRDDLIFGYTHRQRIPLVWNLAGGYNGLKTLELHERTARAARVVDNSIRNAAALRELKPAEQVAADPVALDDVAKQRGPAEG